MHRLANCIVNGYELGLQELSKHCHCFYILTIFAECTLIMYPIVIYRHI